jgi:hypothetical protein
VHVSGKIPLGSVASDQLLVNDRGVSYQGELFRIVQASGKSMAFSRQNYWTIELA